MPVPSSSDPATFAAEMKAFAELAAEFAAKAAALASPAAVERPRRMPRGTSPPVPAAPVLAKPKYRGGVRANMADPRLAGRKVLEREWEGGKIRVQIMPEGFEWGGKLWPSLSAIARMVVGHRRNGYEFFGLLSEEAPVVAKGSRAKANGGRSPRRR